MAILSKRLDFENGIWQEIGAIGFIGQKDRLSVMEICNADALPVGDISEAEAVVGSVNLQFTAPASGSLYGRVRHGTGTLKYYEV